MKNQPRTAINPLIAIILTLTALAAHGGFDHVRGTVVSLNDNVLTVNTSAGNVAVKLDSRTQLTKNDRKAQLSELVPGARVIVEVPQTKDKEKVAQSVKIGVAAPGAASGKPAKK